jgi:predicted nucleic acid-binding protein
MVYLDTSALAKWYLPEEDSEAVEAFLRETPTRVCISDLTRLEMRSLLGRRQRAGAISADERTAIFATFAEDVARGSLHLLPADAAAFDRAIRLIDQLVDVPLRTLDAWHLALAMGANTEVVATADVTMARAARALGQEPVLFGLAAKKPR